MTDRPRDFLDDYLDAQRAAEATPVDEREAFYGSAPADVTSRRLAYLAAKDARLIYTDGTGNWPALRKLHPGLFRSDPPAPVEPDGAAMDAMMRGATLENRAAAADLLLGRPSSLTRKVEGKEA